MTIQADKIVLGKKYTGIEIFSVGKTDCYSYLKISEKKNELIIAESTVNGDIEKLPFDKNSPTLLIINNNNVIHREVWGTDTNDRKLLHKAFPNLNHDDFYYEIWRKKESSVIAICRKQYIEELLAKIKEKISVVGISLGVTATSAIIPMFSEHVINTNSFTIVINDSENSVQLCENIPGRIWDINGLEIKNSEILPFSSILGLLTGTATTGNVLQYNIDAKDAFLQKRFFNKGIKIGISILLILLLINFFTFSYYYDKAITSSEKVSLNTVDIKTLAVLKNRIKEKEKQAGSIISSSSLKSSGQLNQIAASVPVSILLTEINYHPLERKLKQNEPVQIAENIIQIAGSTANGNDFTKWIGKIEEFDWVAGVTILSFGRDEDSTLFNVRINTKT